MTYPKLYVLYPSKHTDITSYEANYFDYYFIYGGTYNSDKKEQQKEMDKKHEIGGSSPLGIHGVISGYRLLTGDAK